MTSRTHITGSRSTSPEDRDNEIDRLVVTAEGPFRSPLSDSARTLQQCEPRPSGPFRRYVPSGDKQVEIPPAIRSALPGGRDCLAWEKESGSHPAGYPRSSVSSLSDRARNR
jgi:hypothetical protein